MRERARSAIALVRIPLRPVREFDDVLCFVAPERDEKRREARVVGPEEVGAARVERDTIAAVDEKEPVALGGDASTVPSGAVYVPS